MSRFIQFSTAGGPEVLHFLDQVTPEPGPHEVRIQVKAIGINRAESMWRTDAYIEPVKLPARLGYEASGLVEAVGRDVVGIRVGDAVDVMPSFSMNDYGTYGELVLVPDYAVVRHPKTLSYEEGASIWMMFTTAYGAFIEDAKIGASDFVVITAASSSVGLAAIQVAKYAGATPIALTRTAAKKAQLLAAGATYVVVTEETDMVAEVMRITGGKGARIVFDPIGGAGFPKLIAMLTFQGIVYIYGALASEPTTIPVLEMIAKMPIIKGHNIWLTSGDEKRRKAAVDFILQGMEAGALKPVIDKTFKFDDMLEVHRYLEQNGQFGKIVVTV